MIIRPFFLATLSAALGAGWRLAAATRGVSTAYSLIFTLGGLLISAGLLAGGLLPFVVAAAGGFMLVGPILLAGFYGIAEAHESGRQIGMAAVFAGFHQAAPALWIIALVCALLFMIFITDAAILYSYMVGGTPVWLEDLLPRSGAIMNFVFWAGVSGAVIAFLLYTASAFAVPLLCERRAGLVEAIVTSTRVVLRNLGPALAWAVLLTVLIMLGILLLPLLPVLLPWLAFASRALYRQVLPPG